MVAIDDGIAEARRGRDDNLRHADFGIAAPCGFGRQPRLAAGLLKEHVDAMAALRALRT